MRTTLLVLGICSLLPVAAPAQEPGTETKIASALSAAPSQLADHATVKDWDGTVLREGSSDWVCLPDMPPTDAADPMCLDAPWLNWIEALMNEGTPSISRMGIGYMMAGSGPESNLIPMAPGPTPDNEWLEQGVPHIMIIVPDAAWLEGLPTHPDQAGGGPWVMWRGAPFVHVMVPTANAGTHGGKD